MNTIKDLSVLVVGTTCCDMTNPNFDFLNDIAGDGMVVDSKRMVPIKLEWLENKENSYAMGGGALNIAPLISLAGINSGILTSLGVCITCEDEDYDSHGQYMLDIMQKTRVQPVIIPNKNLPSSASFIRPAFKGQREVILHAPNAVDALDIENKSTFSLIKQLPKTSIVHYVYSALTKTMDSENGEKLGRVMKELKDLEYITMVDPHTLSKDPKRSIEEKEVIEGYNLLKPVLPHLSWFFASEVEAMMIANTFNYELKSKDQKAKNNEFLLKLIEEFSIDESPRIFGITAGTTAHVVYINQNKPQVGPIIVPSKYVIASADKFVGAGDAFRAGWEVRWSQYQDAYSSKFKSGELSEYHLRRLCHSGHLMAACYITRSPSNQYGNIPRFREMGKVIDSAESYSNEKCLLESLLIR